LVQLANVRGMMGDHRRQIQMLLAALEIAQSLEGKREETRIRINLGHAYLSTEDFRNAVEQFGVASDISEEAGMRMSAYYGLAHAQFRQGHWGEANTFFTRTLEIAEAQNEEGWIAVTLSMLGLTHLEMTDYPGSLEFYERALRIYQRQDDRL